MPLMVTVIGVFIVISLHSFCQGLEMPVSGDLRRDNWMCQFADAIEISDHCVKM
jgi:hypothetical protein